MCPDNIILSAYYDDELEGNFKTTVERHVQSCEHCQSAMRNFKKVDTVLNREDVPLLRNKEYIKTRVFEYNAIRNRRKFWKRGIILPVPLAMTTVALICFLIGGITFFSFNKGKQDMVADHVNTQAIEIQAEELALLQKLLESEGVVVEVNMQIPEQKEIKIIGEPQILTQEQKINFHK